MKKEEQLLEKFQVEELEQRYEMRRWISSNSGPGEINENVHPV